MILISVLSFCFSVGIFSAAALQLKPEHRRSDSFESVNIRSLPHIKELDRKLDNLATHPAWVEGGASTIADVKELLRSFHPDKYAGFRDDLERVDLLEQCETAVAMLNNVKDQLSADEQGDLLRSATAHDEFMKARLELRQLRGLMGQAGEVVPRGSRWNDPTRSSNVVIHVQPRTPNVPPPEVNIPENEPEYANFWTVTDPEWNQFLVENPCKKYALIFGIFFPVIAVISAIWMGAFEAEKFWWARASPLPSNDIVDVLFGSHVLGVFGWSFAIPYLGLLWASIWRPMINGRHTCEVEMCGREVEVCMVARVVTFFMTASMLFFLHFFGIFAEWCNTDSFYDCKDEGIVKASSLIAAVASPTTLVTLVVLCDRFMSCERWPPCLSNERPPEEKVCVTILFGVAVIVTGLMAAVLTGKVGLIIWAVTVFFGMAILNCCPTFFSRHGTVEGQDGNVFSNLFHWITTPIIPPEGIPRAEADLPMNHDDPLDVEFDRVFSTTFSPPRRYSPISGGMQLEVDQPIDFGSVRGMDIAMQRELNRASMQMRDVSRQ